MHPVMRVFIFIIAFVLTLGLLFAAAAPVSVPGASGLQDARGPATQDVAPTSETVRAPLFETVLNLLPTLQGRAVHDHNADPKCPVIQTPQGPFRSCMGNPNRQPYHCREGEYARACADPTKRPPHHTDGGPPRSVTANTAAQIGRAQKDVVVGSAQVRSELKAEHGLLGTLDARGIHEGDDRDAILGNRKDNGSITAGNPNPPYQARGKLRDPPKNPGWHQHCGHYTRGCDPPNGNPAAPRSLDELNIHQGDDREAALGDRKSNGSITAGNPTGGW